MTLNFFNGGVGEPGTVFTSATALLTFIHDNLVLSGWASITNTPGANLIELRGQRGDDNCYLRAYCHTPSYLGGTRYTLELRGGLEQSFTTLSPELNNGAMNNDGFAWQLEFANGFNNTVWMTADVDAFVIAISDFNDGSSIIPCWHFGFYERWQDDFGASDPWAWGLGPMWTYHRFQYVARDAFSGTAWRHLWSDFFRSYNTSFPHSQTRNDARPIEGLCGVYTQATTSDSSSDINNHAPTNFLHFGNINGYDGMVYLSDYYLVEATGINPDYANTQSNFYTLGAPGNQFYYRGNVRFGANGMAHLGTPGSKVTTPGGEVWFTGGLRCIAFRIA